jgi:hypothetical protein
MELGKGVPGLQHMPSLVILPQVAFLKRLHVSTTTFLVLADTTMGDRLTIGVKSLVLRAI